MREKLKEFFLRAHRDERGAIVLLVFAAFLIVFMTSLVLYDAGKSARDKMDVQIAADTAAFSQAAIESRAMNMIAYANVAKRTFYAFDMMYAAAYLGMIEAAVWYAGECGLLNPAACLKMIQGALYVASETAELLGGNFYTMGAHAPGFPERVASEEVMLLDNYQDYMFSIAPWWGWSEGLTRGMRNGATLTSSWPPPPGNLAWVNAIWVLISNLVDTFFDTAYYDLYPSLGASDSLPIAQGDSLWAHLGLCASTAVSTEYLWMWGEHWYRSSGFATDSRSLLFGILSTPLGCLSASMILGDDVLPYDIDPTGSMLDIGGGNTMDEWLEATSNVVISYKMDPARFSEATGGDRQKYMYMSQDYGEGTPLVKGGGYFAVTRSEIVYDAGLISSGAAALQGAFGGPTGGLLGGSIGVLRDVFDQPNMWAARWTARMRPMQLPGEAVPSFNGMFKDMLPYMLLASPIAFAASPGSFSLSGAQAFGSAALIDLAFFEIASMGMSSSSGARGFVK